jgi:hypothetical protein
MTAIPKAQPGSPGLWERIETFSFDVGPTAYSFWARLASENGWSMSFAARAISEYRRFLYLAVVAGHQVSPSDDVDQVWHLHLLYTESYWNSCAATCSLCRCTITRRPAGHLNARSSTPGTGRLSKAIVACSLRIRRRISGRTPSVAQAAPTDISGSTPGARGSFESHGSKGRSVRMLQERRGPGEPANVLLAREEHGSFHPYVSDFGLANPVDAPDAHVGAVVTGAQTIAYGRIVGTASYMSPEQAAGNRATTLSDVYGLGGIMYALLTGRAPLRGDTAAATLAMARDPAQTPPPPPKLNPGTDRTLEAICLTCLKKDPELRSAEGLAKDLDRWLAHRPTEARRLGVVARAGLWCRRNPLGAGLPDGMAGSLP